MLKFFRKLFGIKYLVNISTFEVHRLSNANKACGIDKMSKANKLYVSENKYRTLLSDNDKLNGCIHCNKEDNTDKF